MALVAAFVLGAVVGGATSTVTAGSDGRGPWAVAAADGGGYLVNAQTGEVWRLREELKVPVREPNR
jgi:uncharacterized protein YcfJ